MTERGQTAAADDELFDRLVDGQLTPDQYREFVRSLDGRPDGWRRCALVFLEAQAWGRELRALGQEAPTQPVSPVDAAPPRQRIRQWPMSLAVAASFLVAFGLGVALRGRLPISEPNSAPPTIAVQSPNGSSANDAIVHAGTTTPSSRPRGGRVRDPTYDLVQAGTNSPSPRPGPDLSPEAQGNVRLIMDRGDGSAGEPLEMPVYELSPENAWMLSNQGWTVPPEVRRAMQQLGGDLQRRRQMVPVRGGDGRRIVIPVEQLEITPVRGQRYQ
jgi:anti-sigma factor RsiW